MKKSKNGKRIDRKTFYLIAIIVIALLSAAGTFTGRDAATVFGGPSFDKSGFSVHFIDVGQGDCSLVVCDGRTLLIDAGDNGEEASVINYIRSLKIDALDYVVATHPHGDHIGGIPEALEEFGAENIIMPRINEKLTPTNETYRVFLRAVKNSGARVIAAGPGAKYSLGGAAFEILAPESDDASNLNNLSVIVRVVYRNASFLFTGDAEAPEERELLESGAELKSDLLKVAHHGSKTSSTPDFLARVSPEICVVSCGADNKYGHPDEAVLKRLSRYTGKIYRTDICGDVVVRSDGNAIDVKYENERGDN